MIRDIAAIVATLAIVVGLVACESGPDESWPDAGVHDAEILPDAGCRTLASCRKAGLAPQWWPDPGRWTCGARVTLCVETCEALCCPSALCTSDGACTCDGDPCLP